MVKSLTPASMLAAAFLAGCVHVTTESEIKPIHITMDINLNVDQKISQEFQEESFAARTAPETGAKPGKGDFARIKAMIDRQAAGVTNDGMLAARDIATDDERIEIAEVNARRLQRFAKVARESNVALKTVQRRYASKIVEKLPAQSGIWYQTEDGTWRQR